MFSQNGSLIFAITEDDHPVHLFTISPDLTAKESFIDLSSFKTENKAHFKSFFINNLLYSLVLSDKSVQVIVHDPANGKLVAKHEFNEGTDFSIFALGPVRDFALGMPNPKSIDNFRKLMKELDNGTASIIASLNEKGEIILTAGSYKSLPGDRKPGDYMGGFEKDWGEVGSGRYPTGFVPMRYNPFLNYFPGPSTDMKIPSTKYDATYFKLLVDPSGSRLIKGQISERKMPVTSYRLNDIQKWSALSWFAIGSRTFIGYYHRDEKEYMIDEINMRK